MSDRVVIPFGARFLVLDQAVFEEGLRRGDALSAPPSPPATANADALVDADGLAQALGVERSWVLRKARLREIPFVQVGKYVRFSVAAVVEKLR